MVGYNCGITKKYYGGFLIIFFPPGNIKVCNPNGCSIACHQILCAAYSHPTTSSHSRSLFDTYTWLKPLRYTGIIPVKLSSTKGTFAHPALPPTLQQLATIVTCVPPCPACVLSDAGNYRTNIDGNPLCNNFAINDEQDNWHRCFLPRQALLILLRDIDAKRCIICLSRCNAFNK